MCILLPKNHTGLNSYKYMHLYIQVYKKTPIDVARELGAGGGAGMYMHVHVQMCLYVYKGGGECGAIGPSSIYA